MNKEKLGMFYEKMFEIRTFEESAIDLFKRGLINGTIHPCLGQEAVAAGVCGALQENDYITSTHRGHGHCIGKNMNINEMFAELLGRETGCCRGRGGSMHIADLRKGVLGANGIVAGGIPIAVGAAKSIALRKTNQVVISFFGDAAINQGAFHEAVNLAAAWKLPVVFVCENNLYGVSTRIDTTVAIDKIEERALGYSIPGTTVDGNDVLAVYEAASSFIKRAREGYGPAFLVCDTYRWEGHFFGEPGIYRTTDEVEEWKKKDPVVRFKDYLIANKIMTSDEISGIEKKVLERIDAGVQFALNSPPADASTLLADVYCSL